MPDSKETLCSECLSAPTTEEICAECAEKINKIYCVDCNRKLDEFGRCRSCDACAGGR